MKKISLLSILMISFSMPVFAGYSPDAFKAEIIEGLDLVSARENVDLPEFASGEMGLEVYQTADNVPNEDMQLFIPTSMYIRAGGGFNLGFATDKAKIGDKEYESSGSWTTQIGLGWNLSSYVRTEIDLQESTFNFSGLDDMQASYQTVGGMLYFDFARRYVMSGDITTRRTFVPFMGIGAALGQYRFDGETGADGFVVAAPRATLGFNVMLNDLIGLDIMYQYQMMIGNGFGWNVREGGVDNISNIVASFRVNF